MAFQLSPGINVSEIDLTTAVPSVATSIGGFAGKFAWGPINQIVSIGNEVRLAETFGKPDGDNYEYWFSAANFLAYSNNLKVVRAAGTGTLNATANGGVLIENETDYLENHRGANTNGAFAAKYAGALGNGLRVEICPNPEAFSNNFGTGAITAAVANTDTVINVASSLSYQIAEGDSIQLSANGSSTSYLTVASVNAVANTVTLTTPVGTAFNVTANTSLTRRWRYYSQFTDAPGTSDYADRAGGADDEMHIVVIDTQSKFSTAANTVVEKFGFVSKASDAKNSDGSTNYYADVLANRSKYIWWLSHPAQSNNWGGVAANTFTEAAIAVGAPANYANTLAGGADGTIAPANITTAYDIFADADATDVSLLVSGPANETVADALAALAETRKDCMVFVSPEKADVVDNSGSEVTDILTYRTALTSSSYVVMDSGWKYQYDKYNDTYRWVPLNGDIAGLCARADLERDPWISPAGPQRGIIKNIVKLAFNPSKAERDDLYTKGINPVVTFSGEGTMLYGDKTLLNRPSAFDRINVRRLFIVLEKSISRASRSTLFEFNDQFTRAQFINLVEPYLRDVQGRRGISDFRVVCDETNNTPEVIDRNEFVGDIYIKPARSVNFIQLNFVAARTGVSFDEIVGSF
jgi:hypothetical protein